MIGFPARPLDGAPPVPEGGLWLLNLDQVDADQIDPAELTDAEQARNARFATATLRRRDRVVRAWLRRTLAAYTGRPAHDLHWIIGEHGKPAFATPGGVSQPWFNLSHSAHLAVIAICERHEIGVDIECLRQFEADDVDPLARTILTARELDALSALAPAQRSTALLTAWTRKEACVKALGLGLSLPVDQLQTGLGLDPALVHCPTPAAGEPGLRLSVRSACIHENAVCSTAWRAPQNA